MSGDPARTTPAERLVRERLQTAGRLTFAELMAIALYDPAVGYYSAERSPFGERGDYYTSPLLHPAFAALLGRQLEQLWRWLDRPAPFVVLEAGPGSGLFARDLLDGLRARVPELYEAIEYRLDERSEALRRRQQATLAHAGLMERARWIAAPAEAGAAHLVLANELLDALPVHLVERRGGELLELYVELDGDRLVERPGPPSRPELAAYFERLGLWPAEGCRAEVNLAALEWVGAAGRALGRGLLLVLDYGYPAEHLYTPARRLGTLLCYYRHTLNSEPLARLGEQDLTSHVDFTSLRWAGERAGLETMGLVSQRRLLTQLGLPSLAAAIGAARLGQAEQDANLRALEALVDPEGLGRVLALVQARGLGDFAPWGLVGGPAPDWSGGPPLRGPEHLRLPEPFEAEGLPDFEAQWSEFWSGSEAQ